jgi:hypothetical protein
LLGVEDYLLKTPENPLDVGCLTNENGRKEWGESGLEKIQACPSLPWE